MDNLDIVLNKISDTKPGESICFNDTEQIALDLLLIELLWRRSEMGVYEETGKE